MRPVVRFARPPAAPAIPCRSSWATAAPMSTPALRISLSPAPSATIAGGTSSGQYVPTGESDGPAASSDDAADDVGDGLDPHAPSATPQTMIASAQAPSARIARLAAPAGE